MKYVFIIAALLYAAMTVTAESVQHKDYAINVGQFDKLKIDDNVDVVYRNLPDSTGYVAYRGEEEFADAFILTPNNGSLRIQVNTEDVNRPGLPTLYVYSDFLTSVTTCSIRHVAIESVAPSPEFKITLIGNGSISADNVKANKVLAKIATGNGNITISGKTPEATFSMVGTGTIQADRLEANIVNCKIIGAGTIGCSPIDKLNVRGIGSTKIYYTGDPDIRKAGGGKLFQIPAGEEGIYIPKEIPEAKDRRDASEDTLSKDPDPMDETAEEDTEPDDDNEEEEEEEEDDTEEDAEPLE